MEVERVLREPGGDEADMPVFDADAPMPSLRSVGRPRVTGKRGGSGRGVAAAVGVLVLLVAGVAVGGLLETPHPTGDLALGDASATPFKCTDISFIKVPPFGLHVAGRDDAIAGVTGLMHIAHNEAGSASWQVPSLEPDRALEVTSSDRLKLRVPSGECIRMLEADAVPASIAAPGQYDYVPVVHGDVDDNPEPALGTLPEGDWVVRVIAHFETEATHSKGAVFGTRYFRIRVGDGPFASLPTPTPRPAATPTLPCNPAEVTEAGFAAILNAPTKQSVAGVTDGETPAPVNMGPGDVAELAIVDDFCALSWSITTLDAESGTPVRVDAVENPSDSPGYAAQNHWPVQFDAGTFDVIASFHIHQGLDIVRVWRVVSSGFSVPETLLVADDGSRVAALPGCGLSVQLSNGYSSGDPCDQIGFPEGLEELRVPAWSRVELQVPGWTLSNWNGSCGYLTDEGGQQVFQWSCSLGGWYVDGIASPPGPAQFLARPGHQVLQLYLTATSDSGTFNVPMFALVWGR